MKVEEHIAEISDALEIIGKAVGRIQMHRNELERNHMDRANRFVMLTDFMDSMNKAELDFHEVRKTFEERINNEET